MDIKKIAIVGNPNVGKSVLFNALTKQYVVVSNYPGTTVEVSRGKMSIGGEEYEVIDTLKSKYNPTAKNEDIFIVDVAKYSQ